MFTWNRCVRQDRSIKLMDLCLSCSLSQIHHTQIVMAEDVPQKVEGRNTILCQRRKLIYGNIQVWIILELLASVRQWRSRWLKFFFFSWLTQPLIGDGTQIPTTLFFLATQTSLEAGSDCQSSYPDINKTIIRQTCLNYGFTIITMYLRYSWHSLTLRYKVAPQESHKNTQTHTVLSVMHKL